MRNLIHTSIRFGLKLIASGLGSGYAPKAPGTAGSIAALAFWYLLVSLGLIATAFDSFIFALCLIIVGHLTITAFLKNNSSPKDPQWIVIDEWAGLAIALIPATNQHILCPLLALLLFRFFDVVKPGPISSLERLPGSYGIMTDDLAAGLCSAILIWIGLVVAT